jgi:hypothetical protein
MNSDHADAVALYATQLANSPPGEWRMVGIDPGGCDLLHRTQCRAHRLPRTGAYAGSGACGLGCASEGSALAYWSDRLTSNQTLVPKF